MLRTKTAIVVTVLMIGNFAVSLQAVPLQIVQAEPAPSNGKNLKKRISQMLELPEDHILLSSSQTGMGRESIWNYIQTEIS